MLSLCDPERVIRQVFQIARAHDDRRHLETFDELRNGYLSFLKARQPDVPVNSTHDFFVSDSSTQDRLSAAFAKGALNDLNQEDVVGDSYDIENLNAKTYLARQALEGLLDLDDDFTYIFELVIHSIFVRPSKPARIAHGSHGGSSSASIGAIWLAVGEKITEADLVEMLVHELTHHLMFIDELNNPQFNYKLIVAKENFARSAILKRMRPLDKVIHSIAVGASIVDARNRFLTDQATIIHPKTGTLVSDTLLAIESVRDLSNVDQLLTPHTLDLVCECEKICQDSVAIT